MGSRTSLNSAKDPPQLGGTSKHCLVDGYIRLQSIKLKLKLIPDVIIDLCYNYWIEPMSIPLILHSYRGALSGSDHNGPSMIASY